MALDARSALDFGFMIREGGQSDERCRTREGSRDDMCCDVVRGVKAMITRRTW